MYQVDYQTGTDRRTVVLNDRQLAYRAYEKVERTHGVAWVALTEDVRGRKGYRTIVSRGVPLDNGVTGRFRR